MKVFLTGATGFVGLSLTDDLTRMQIEVHALVRDHASAHLVRQRGAIPTIGDLTIPESYADALKVVDAVIHLGAKIGFFGSLDHYYPINVEGTRNLVQAAIANGIKTFVHVSAAAIALNGSPLIDIDENFQPPKMIPIGYLESKVLAESEILKHRENIRIFILRPPIIWGPGMRIMEQFRSTIKKMGFPVIGKPDHKLPTCHVKNLNAAIILGLEHPKAAGVFLISDEERAEARKFLQRLIKAYGMDMGNLRLPPKPALIAAGMVEGLWRLLKLKGDPPMTRFTVHLMGTEFTIDNSKIRETLGYKEAISMEAGFRQLEET